MSCRRNCILLRVDVGGGKGGDSGCACSTGCCGGDGGGGIGDDGVLQRHWSAVLHWPVLLVPVLKYRVPDSK